MRLNPVVYALIVFATVPAGCDNSSGPDLSMCSGSVTLTFTAAPAATLSWTPNCRVDHVVVEVPLPPSIGGGSDVTWQITARGEGEGAAAPLRYGAIPGGMEELVAAEPLVAGRFYRVRLFASDVMVSELNFQYWPPD